MSFWGQLNGQGNGPPRNSTHQGPPGAASASGHNGLGLGFQPALPLGIPPPTNNHPQQINIHPFLTASLNNPGPHPSVNPLGITSAAISHVPGHGPGHGHSHSYGGGPSNQANYQAQAQGNDIDDDEFDDDDDSDAENVDPDQLYDESSPIILKIRVPVNVDGNNNVVSIDTVKVAKQVAKHITDTLSELSCGPGGIPMIDHNGELRPVNITVDCQIRVKGDRNMLGEKAVMSMIPRPLRQAMIAGLPISPMSSDEERALEVLVDRNRMETAGGSDQKKRERSRSQDKSEDGKSAKGKSPLKRNRAQ